MPKPIKQRDDWVDPELEEPELIVEASSTLGLKSKQSLN